MQNNNSQNIFSEAFSYLQDDRISTGSKLFLFVATIGYAIFPFDIFPDVLLPFGIIDDAGIIVAAVNFFVSQARKQIADPTPTAKVDGDAQMVVTPPPAGGMSFLAGCGIFFILIFLIVGGIGSWGIYTGAQSILSIRGQVEDFLAGESGAAVIIDQITTNLTAEGTLVTQSASSSSPRVTVRASEGILGVCRHSATYTVEGTIEAGINLTGFRDNQVTFDPISREYTITLPAAEITGCRVDTIDQIERTIIPCGSRDDLRQIAQYEFTNDSVEEALDEDILNFAEREAADTIESLVGGLTNRSINIVFEETDTPEIDRSCTQNLPIDWEYDDSEGRWVKEED